MVDPVRGSANLVARFVEFGVAGVNELARLGSDFLLAALLARLGRTDRDDVSEELPDAVDADLGVEGDLLGLRIHPRHEHHDAPLRRGDDGRGPPQPRPAGATGTSPPCRRRRRLWESTSPLPG